MGVQVDDGGVGNGSVDGFVVGQSEHSPGNNKNRRCLAIKGSQVTQMEWYAPISPANVRG